MFRFLSQSWLVCWVGYFTYLFFDLFTIEWVGQFDEIIIADRLFLTAPLLSSAFFFYLLCNLFNDFYWIALSMFMMSLFVRFLCSLFFFLLNVWDLDFIDLFVENALFLKNLTDYLFLITIIMVPGVLLIFYASSITGFWYFVSLLVIGWSLSAFFLWSVLESFCIFYGVFLFGLLEYRKALRRFLTNYQYSYES